MGFERDVEQLGVLVEPQRRRIYEHLSRAPSALTLTELADELGLGRTLTSFHLGKLVDAGFVDVVAAQAGSGRRGRPSQTYRASDRDVAASVPPRHYDVVAGVLLQAAATQVAGETVQAAARRVARQQGRVVALAAPKARGGPLRTLERLLDRLGYAPRRDGGTLVLRNCPFDKLREDNLELVCGINHALAEGYLDAVDPGQALTATLRPCPDSCCVVVSPRP